MGQQEIDLRVYKGGLCFEDSSDVYVDSDAHINRIQDRFT
jgi:hypothetical protein